MTTALELGDAGTRERRLRDLVDAGRESLRRRHEEGAAGREIVRSYSRLLIQATSSLFEALLVEAGAPEGMALAGIGGFGRLELAPYSDVDLLLIHDGLEEGVVAKVAEPLFRTLWDAKIEIGASVRTPEECARIAAEDHTARTALLDCRYLGGDRAIYERLERKVLVDLGRALVDELVVAKTEELRKRRERFGGSVHLLEPNLKQSPGGLRDLQAALWIARARFHAGGLSDLVALQIFPRREVERLKEAREFLWRARNQLHYLAGRKEDHLTFHWQEEVARTLGYRDREPEGLAVEQFMRDYYLAAASLRRLADELIERCAPPRAGAPLAGDRPLPADLRSRSGIASAGASASVRAAGEEALFLRGGRLALADGASLSMDPSLFVRLFTTAEALDVDLEGATRDRIREEASRIDEATRCDPALSAALRAAFRQLGRGDWLRSMHREGVLGALLPEFGRITAKHQHDVYHVYTVDTHSILAMQRLGDLRHGALADEEPKLSLVARELPRPLALSLGVLLHDAGKGMGGDHSLRSAELVRQVCARLGVGEVEAADAEFLVREHLAMSHVSQRRDLSDPELIEDFATRMGNRERLDMLFVLTYVDIASVGPTTWTEWKGRLLLELHQKTAAALTGWSQAHPSCDDLEASQRGSPSTRGAAQREALSARGADPGRIDAFLARMPRRYFAFADPDDAFRSLRVLELGAKRPLATAIRDSGNETSLTLSARDRPGLLSSIAGVLTAHRIDILRADVFSTHDGRALDVFVLRGPDGGRVERGRWRGARRDLQRILAGESTAEELLARLRRSPGLPPRHLPAVATKVKLDDRSSRRFTVVDVFAPDRRGLLHAVTAALHQASLSISVARITTEGDRAIDSFYVCDHAGRKIEGAPQVAEVKALILAAVASIS